MTNRLYLSLGSNQGDREEQIRQAIAALEQKLGVPCAACSSFWQTRPWGQWNASAPAEASLAESAEPLPVADFINAAVCFELASAAPPTEAAPTEATPTEPTATALAAVSLARPTLSPHGLLALCKEIEREMGRQGEPQYDEKGERIYASRPIDIDILLWGDLVCEEPDLKIPHPLMWERDFVLDPLAEIADDELKLKIIKNKKL